jgi:hypothetical protein
MNEICDHLNYGSSKAKAWPVILVSERQKGHKRPFVQGVTTKGIPSQMNKSLEEASEKMQKAVRCLASQEKQHQRQ